MDLLGGFLPSNGEECAAGPPTSPYPNNSILLDEDALNESTINDSDMSWMPAANVSMDTVLSEMMGIMSAVEVNVDASDVPTVAPNPELNLCNVCGNTPCEFVDYKDEIFDTVIGHLFLICFDKGLKSLPIQCCGSCQVCKCFCHLVMVLLIHHGICSMETGMLGQMLLHSKVPLCL